MTLPTALVQLLRLLDSDHRSIMKQAAGMDHAVMMSGLLSTDELDRALELAKQRECQVPGSQRSLLKAYASLAIVK